MSFTHSAWYGTVVQIATVCLVVCQSVVFAADQHAKKMSFKPLPKDVVVAWKDAGFQVGGMRIPDKPGVPWRILSQQEKSTDLPTFIVKGRWPSAELTRLPVPPRAFGVSLVFVNAESPALAKVATLKNLQAMDLSLCHPKDAALRQLAGMKNLKHLNISANFISDAGLVHLAELKSLQTLNLSNAGRITDAGLKELAKLKKLRTLFLRNVRAVTDAGVKQLQHALPKCKIIRQ